ncbi:MAG: class I SAM-dependent methyltransferase [Bacteroidota bacterium]
MADLSTGTNFDPVARYYDRLAHLVFGNTLLHARLHFLSQIPKGAQVLVVGGGTGAILPALFNQIGETGSVYYLEYSEKMIEQAQVRMSGTAANMVWKRGTVADLPSDLQVEVIITNFFLDLFLRSLSF